MSVVTDRTAAYLVVLDDDVREPADAWTLNAIRMIHGVKSVTPVPASYEQAIAQERRDQVWADALRKLAADGPGESRE